MAHKVPGKSDREGQSIIELRVPIPPQEAATKWFEAQGWPRERCCGHCGSMKASEVANAAPMPCWSRACRSDFDVRTGAVPNRGSERVPGRLAAQRMCIPMLRRSSAPKPSDS